MLEAEVHRRARDARAVRLELVVGADLRVLADVGIYSLGLVGTHREDIPLILEQPSRHAASMRLASGIESVALNVGTGETICSGLCKSIFQRLISFVRAGRNRRI